VTRSRALLADLDRRRAGRIVGTWTQFTDPQFVDLIGHAGFDFTIIDGEHGAFGIGTAAALVRAAEAAGVVPLVRVPRGDPSWITKLLDAGAAGIVAPAVESAGEAAALVAALRFAPTGTRSACPIVRMADHSLSDWSQAAASQDGAGVIALIETVAGVEQCEAIAETPGLAAVMVGPFDLSVSLGWPGMVEHEQVARSIARIVAACRRAARPVWMPVFAPEPSTLAAQIARWSVEGVRHFVIGADKIVAARALRRYREAASD
jgi:4-hydroxy-2-oxoheptanedioate aldolase